MLFRGVVLGFLALLAPGLARAEPAFVPVPPLERRVTDFTHTLSAVEANGLEQKIAAFESGKGAQIAVLMVPGTAPETIEQYAIRVAEQWKLGRKGVDDGALLLIAKGERRVRIEVGYGLEGAIPDAIARRIIAEHIVPRFRESDYVGGIDAGLTQMMKVVEGEPLPAPRVAPEAEPVPGWLFLVLLLAFFAGFALRSVVAPVLGASVSSAAAGVFGALAGGTLVAGIVLAALAFLFVLFQGLGALRGPHVGGGGFGGGWGGTGGGGWSGGGGGFGGGGASGEW